MRNVANAKRPKVPPGPIGVILLCAGVSRTMNAYGSKSLLKIDGQSIINYQISTIRNSMNADITCVVGFEKKRVIQDLPDDIRIVENENYLKSSINRSIALALRTILHKRLLIIHGDILFNESCLTDLVNQSAVLYDDQKRFKYDKIGVLVQHNKAINFAYGLDSKWAQIVYLHDKELDLFRQECLSTEDSQLNTHEILNKVVDAGGTIAAIQPKFAKIIEINSVHNIKNFRTQ
jgi:CTP:phosphocholine cytidylyltransferase-like protein